MSDHANNQPPRANRQQPTANRQPPTANNQTQQKIEGKTPSNWDKSANGLNLEGKVPFN
ncbi:hypothetical protein [Paenibacillus agaridevorans]|uniref:hypothetical protein n=1 Tax=Paenibacillus agaridevorans TaxID=171404 RepID=UPI001BE48BAB|nr:hypothetical protein [Paenibacillus agaridevorans]